MPCCRANGHLLTLHHMVARIAPESVGVVATEIVTASQCRRSRPLYARARIFSLRISALAQRCPPSRLTLDSPRLQSPGCEAPTPCLAVAKLIPLMGRVCRSAANRGPACHNGEPLPAQHSNARKVPHTPTICHRRLLRQPHCGHRRARARRACFASFICSWNMFQWAEPGSRNCWRRQGCPRAQKRSSGTEATKTYRGYIADTLMLPTPSADPFCATPF